MPSLEIRKQVRLGWGRTLEICLNGLGFRLFRSSITVAIISIAIAFMMYMLSGSVVGRSVYRYAYAHASTYKLYGVWLSWLDETMDEDRIFRIAAHAPSSDPRLHALSVWGGLSNDQTDNLLDSARRCSKYLRFLADLSPGRRFLLLGTTETERLIEKLADPESFNRFRDRFAKIGALRLPGTFEAFRTDIDTHAAQSETWRTIAERRRAAIQALAQRYPGTTTGALLANPPDDFQATLSELGFAADFRDLPLVREQARDRQHLAAFAKVLRHPAVKREVAKRMGLKPLLVNMDELAKLHLSRTGPRFFVERLKKHGVPAPMPAAQAAGFFAQYAKRGRILNIEQESAEYKTEGFLGFAPKTIWLIAVSFVVCAVGIANAMLMSVMERFREIATMKCLGATDSFVMALFVLESCILGLVGGILGALLGLFLSLPTLLLKYGTLVFTVMPMPTILRAGGVAMLTGIVLAAIAAVYPAYVAARLVPMEAMRLE